MPIRLCSTLQRFIKRWLRATASHRPVRALHLPRLALPVAGATLLLLAMALGLAAARRAAVGAPPSVALATVPSGQPASSRPGFLVYHGVVAPTSSPQPLRLSARGGERPTIAPSPTPTAMKATSYTVARGDTVNALAKRFGISPETILWANGLNSGQDLKAGGELTILPVSGVLYQVRKGDTLNAIAEAHKAEAGAIIEANALAAADLILVGQPLIIPGGRPAPRPTLKPTSAPLPPVADAGEATGSGGDIITIAARYLGYPYVYAGSSPSTGFDCSGFSQYVYGQAGRSISRTVAGQLSNGAPVQRNELLPGDLVFFHNTFRAGLSHVGIYVGGGKFIHASSPSRGVCYDSLEAPYWTAHYHGACRAWQ